MHPTERALVQAIRATDSDALRLILADWLEEHGRERDGYTIRFHLLHKARFLREWYAAHPAQPSPVPVVSGHGKPRRRAPRSTTRPDPDGTQGGAPDR